MTTPAANKSYATTDIDVQGGKSNSVICEARVHTAGNPSMIVTEEKGKIKSIEVKHLKESSSLYTKLLDVCIHSIEKWKREHRKPPITHTAPPPQKHGHGHGHGRKHGHGHKYGHHKGEWHHHKAMMSRIFTNAESLVTKGSGFIK